MAEAFADMLDTWHSAPETWDSKLDAEIHRQYAEVLSGKPVFPPRNIPYFSPSSANSCKRELYVKLTGGKRDKTVRPPYQGRWTRLGTAIGDTLQRDLLFIGKHYEKTIGERPRFVPKTTGDPDYYPMWEDFAKKAHTVEHNGFTFALYGTPDGILIDTRTGEYVGLEVKSKQTTHAQTSLYSMKEPKEDHARQIIAYSIMYGVDDYLITYLNGSKKGWHISEEDYVKNPDLRVFHVYVTESDRQALLDGFTGVLQAVKDGNPPPLDIEKFVFNNYKTACALSLSDDEFTEIKEMVSRVRKSNIQNWKKKNYDEALRFIEEVRCAENG
jgi:hypothetical protein